MIQIRDTTVGSSTISVETLDIYRVYSLKNVKMYRHSNYNTWDIECYKSDGTGTENIYFAIDTYSHEAFAHWVYESAIYLPLFAILRERHPTIKLFLKQAKTYKYIFCKYLGISDDDIVYDVVANDPSICYFPSPISCLNQTEISDEYMRHIDRFWSIFRIDTHISQHPIAVLPRQQRENYAGNNRTVPFSDIINYANTIHNSRIVHTDTINDLSIQIQAIVDSGIIVVTDGSPFLVNGMFSYNKHIIISGQSCTIGQGANFKKMAYIIQKIKAQNTSLMYITGQAETCNKIRELLRS